MEYKLIDAPQLAMKAADDAAADSTDLGTIEGYGSTFGNIDSYNERVLKGAFIDTLAEFINDGFIAFAHKWGSLPVATPTTAMEDSTGLKFIAEYHSTSEAQDARTVVRERLERRKSVKLSIGYEVLEDRQDKDKVRELVKLRLFEISIVTVPANVMAAVTEAKGGFGPFDHLRSPGLRLDAHLDAALATVEGIQSRMAGYKAMLDAELKEGRPLTAARIKRILEYADGLDGHGDGSHAIAKGLRDLVAEAMDGKGEDIPTTTERTPEEKAIFGEFRRLKLLRQAQGKYVPASE